MKPNTREVWKIKNVKEETILTYRVYAVKNRISTAEALEAGAKLLEGEK